MQICTACKKEKDGAQFVSKFGKVARQCDDCREEFRKYQREYIERRGRKKHNAQQREIRARWLAKPCAVGMKRCGYCMNELPLEKFGVTLRGKQGRNCDDCRKYMNDWARRDYTQNLDHNRKVARERMRRARQACLDHYGHRCACCGATGDDFLAMDHINGDGATHRKEVKPGALSYWLKRQGFPKEFQTLCWSCNWSKSNGTHCAHVDERLDSAPHLEGTYISI